MIPAKHNTEAEIDAFADVCDRLTGFNERISMEWADGYLTALCAGPRTISIDEWLAAMVGEDFQRAFADPEDVAKAMRALQARYAAIADALEPSRLLDDEDVLHLNPLIAEWTDEEKQRIVEENQLAGDDADFPEVGAIWSLGFFEAIEDFAADWPAYRSPVLTERAKAQLGWQPRFSFIEAYRKIRGHEPRLRA